MNTDLGYFTMSIRNLDRGKAFFGALFDWKFEAEPEKSTHRYAHVDGSIPPFGLNDMDGPPVRLYFRVADIEAAVTRVRELGGEVDEHGTSETGGHAECRDDQGTHFSLWQPAPEYS
jgi:uncharacterized protein